MPVSSIMMLCGGCGWDADAVRDSEMSEVTSLGAEGSRTKVHLTWAEECEC